MNTQVHVNECLGALIRATRRRRGWTLEGLHERLLAAGGPAPSVPTLSRIERGFATFTVQEAGCACRVLGISFHVLQHTLRVRRIGNVVPMNAELLLQRGPELFAIGALDELLLQLEAAHERCADDPQADPLVRLRLAHQLSFLHRTLRNFDIARYFARSVLATPGVDDIQRLYANVALMATDAKEARWAEYIARRTALEIAVRRLDGRELAFVAMTIGANERWRGAFGSGRPWLELALPIYAELKDLNALRGRVTLGECLYHTGARTSGLELIDVSYHEALAHGYLEAARFARAAYDKAVRSA